MKEERDTLLAGHLRLLDAKREGVHALRERGGESPSCVEALVNDLVGIKLVVSAALLAGGIGEAKREDLERREREARELLRGTWALGSAGRGTRIAPKLSQRPV